MADMDSVAEQKQASFYVELISAHHACLCVLTAMTAAGNLFEEVLPKKVLDCRTATNGSKEYLLQWLDGSEDSWVNFIA